MPTQCSAQQLEFSSVEKRRVVAAFDGGRISSDAGALLLQQADQRLGLLEGLAQCFEDRRDADLIEHLVRTLGQGPATPRRAGQREAARCCDLDELRRCTGCT